MAWFQYQSTYSIRRCNWLPVGYAGYEATIDIPGFDQGLLNTSVLRSPCFDCQQAVRIKPVLRDRYRGRFVMDGCWFFRCQTERNFVAGSGGVVNRVHMSDVRVRQWVSSLWVVGPAVWVLGRWVSDGRRVLICCGSHVGRLPPSLPLHQPSLSCWLPTHLLLVRPPPPINNW